jgi:hypothetical protein
MKSGDRVMVIKNTCDWNENYNDKFVGQTGKIVYDCHKKWPYEVEFDNPEYENTCWSESELELVKEE